MNCRSIINKTHELEAVLLSYQPDIVALTETWMHSGILDHEVVPPGYAILRKDRKTRGGGVALLIRHGIPYTAMPMASDIEAVWCKFYVKDEITYIGVVYRPPDAEVSFLEALYDYMLTHALRGKKIIVAGDFNLPEVKWDSLNLATKTGNVLADIMFTFNLTQVVTVPTRNQGSFASILDLFFVSDHFLKYPINVETLEGLSDHKIVSCCLQYPSAIHTKATTKRVPAFKRADDAAIMTYLALEFSNFLDLYSNEHSTVNMIWSTFSNIVRHCIDNFVPTVTKSIKKHNPWITRDIIHMKRKLKRLRKAQKVHPRSCIASEIPALARSLKKQVNLAKKRFLSHSLHSFIKTAPHKFWRYISVKHTNKAYTPTPGGKQTADHFNSYFQSVFTADNGLLQRDQFRPSGVDTPLDTPFISQAGVLSLLLNLDEKKSTGPDDIPNAFLKRYAEPVSKFLQLIYLKSLRVGHLPADWKLAKIIPVHKSGDTFSPANYRPISLTCTSCKILEHIILKYLTEFVESHNILHSNQHGFRSGLSTVTQLVETLHDFAKDVNSQLQTDVIFMDFSKAFDRVSHLKLNYKLRCLLGEGPLTRWIEDYLSDRYQYVQYNAHVSDTVPVLSGVPQGSVLAPMLFLLYINDITKHVDVNIRLFADDCVLYHTIKTEDDQTKLSNSLYKVSQWCSDWQMVLNAEKTVYMNITNKKSTLTFPYSINGTPLRNVSQYKYLGVTISSDLSWNAHVQQISKKAMNKLFFLKRSLAGSTFETRSLAYTSLIRPTLEYASITWFPHTKYNIAALERVQRKAVRFIFNRYRRSDSPTELLRQAGLTTLSNRARVHRLKFLYLLLKNNFKINPRSFVTYSSARETRHKHKFTLEEFRPTNNVFRFSFFPRVVRDWNALDEITVTQPTLELFSELVERAV